MCGTALMCHHLLKGVERLNLKCKNFKDLLTDEPFKRSDIIHLQVMCYTHVCPKIITLM